MCQVKISPQNTPPSMLSLPFFSTFNKNEMRLNRVRKAVSTYRHPQSNSPESDFNKVNFCKNFRDVVPLLTS